VLYHKHGKRGTSEGQRRNDDQSIRQTEYLAKKDVGRLRSKGDHGFEGKS
jgi:hypothetical protein